MQFDADYWVNGIAFNGDGTQFAWMDTALHVFDIASGEEVLNAPVDAVGIGPINYTPDDRAIAYADGNTIVLVSSIRQANRRSMRQRPVCCPRGLPSILREPF